MPPPKKKARPADIKMEKSDHVLPLVETLAASSTDLMPESEAQPVETLAARSTDLMPESKAQPKARPRNSGEDARATNSDAKFKAKSYPQPVRPKFKAKFCARAVSDESCYITKVAWDRYM